MKIGVNARFLLIPYSGIGQYTRNLILALSKIDKKNEYFLVVPKNLPKKEQLKLPKNFKIKVLKERKMGSKGAQKTWWEQIQVPRLFKELNVDVAHFPYPCNPRFSFDIPTLLTIHDTIPWENKKYRSGILSTIYHKNAQKAAIKATKIVTVSKSARKNIGQKLNIPTRQIEVVYNAADPIYQKKAKKIKLPTKNPYFIYVGGYDERKNIERLIKAYLAYIAPKHNIDLILVGGKLHKTKLYKGFDCLQNSQGESKIKPYLSGNIIPTGFIDSAELNALYENALAFVNFSLMEGFNIGIAEAATKKLPLILSDIEVHREVSNKQALFAKPNSVKAIGAALEKFLKNKKQIKPKLSYSWNDSAKKILSLFKSLIK